MSNKAFQQNLDDKKGPQSGGPYLIQMLFKEPVEMPDIILLEQLRTIDKSRLRDKLGSLGEDQMCKLDHALEVSVGLLPIYNTI